MAATMFVGRSQLRFLDRARFEIGDVRLRLSLILSAIICSPLIGASVYYALQRGSDFARSTMLRDPSTMVAINTTTSGYLADANQMMGPLTILIAWLFRFRPLALIPFGLFVFFRMYVGWGRWTFLMGAASLALLFFFHTKRKWPTVRIALAAAALLLAFNALGQSRSFLQDLVTGQKTQTTASDSSRIPLDSMDFANLEYLEYILTIVPERTGTYDYFLRNLQVFTEPIPRTLWPEKPVGPPIQLYNIFQFGFPIGITWTLVGEGWQDLGFFGVVFWCAFAGALLGGLYEWFVRSDQGAFKVALFAVLLPLSVQWFRDGILLTAVKFPFFFVLPIMLWYLIYQMIARHSASGSRAHSR
ncbi:hypothetical protein [Bradyrhizobium ottawaense]|uniref:hypothetical protein n=1 Tax=Bradyrhizobium ottawaense TaxID=931866 RepID=UPI001BA7839F|nr:hypothetical protein [Bradyrhizobium ottawaense]MBR1335194.1 hypothetical protein [Bradyrhizobium ottawaense]